MRLCHATLLTALALSLGGCDLLRGAPKVAATSKRDFSKPTGPPVVAATLPLSNGAQAHVIHVPLPYGDAAQCVSVVGASGAVAVSCLPKGIDLPPDE